MHIDNQKQRSEERISPVPLDENEKLLIHDAEFYIFVAY
jgi:hypothetical protein